MYTKLQYGKKYAPKGYWGVYDFGFQDGLSRLFDKTVLPKDYDSVIGNVLGANERDVETQYEFFQNYNEGFENGLEVANNLSYNPPEDFKTTYKIGYQAHLEGMAEFSNPHTNASEQNEFVQWWNRGWWDAGAALAEFRQKNN